MKHLKMAFGLVVVVAGLMAVAASPAMAAPKWVHCVKVATGGQWSSGTCKTAGTGWETKAITETSEVTTSGKLELEDQEAPGGAVAITCTGRDLGWVANLSTSAEGGMFNISSIACTFVSGKNGSCESTKAVTAAPRNLPWGTKLEEKSGEVRGTLVSGSTSGAPGWAVECTVAGVLKITDTCERSGNTTKEKNSSEGTIESEFDNVTKEEPMATCSASGKASGLVRGIITAKLRSGNAFWILAPVSGFPA